MPKIMYPEGQKPSDHDMMMAALLGGPEGENQAAVRAQNMRAPAARPLSADSGAVIPIHQRMREEREAAARRTADTTAALPPGRFDPSKGRVVREETQPQKSAMPMRRMVSGTQPSITPTETKKPGLFGRLFK